MSKEEKLYSTGKIAEEAGISAGKVKKAIESLGLKPHSTKGKCAYYTGADLKKIKKETSE
ncbi:MAG: hypothetical protein OEZ13_09905 [Spirochaetia bacterium]|nr:hypothetical protein [Spirochaetia bacterium]